MSSLLGFFVFLEVKFRSLILAARNRILSRAHSNYLAQINIRMNERAEQTADVLGKLTVLGTIVLPMNIITGMWGMNVKVPGQEDDNQVWFWSSESLVFFLISIFSPVLFPPLLAHPLFPLSFNPSSFLSFP